MNRFSCFVGLIIVLASPLAYGDDLLSNDSRVTERFLHSESFTYTAGRIYYGSADFDEPMVTSTLRVRFACNYGIQRYYPLEYWSDGDHHHFFSNYDPVSQTYKIEAGAFQHLNYSVQPYIFQNGACTVTFSAFIVGYPGPQATWTKIADLTTGNANEVVIPPIKLNQKVGGVKIVFPDVPSCSNIDPTVRFFDGNGQSTNIPTTSVFFDDVDGKFVFSFGLLTITEVGSIGISLKGKPGCNGSLYITAD